MNRNSQLDWDINTTTQLYSKLYTTSNQLDWVINAAATLHSTAAAKRKHYRTPTQSIHSCSCRNIRRDPALIGIKEGRHYRTKKTTTMQNPSPTPL